VAYEPHGGGVSKFTATDKLFRQVILQERPAICEHCRKDDGRMVYVAHILAKGGEWARLRYTRTNVLLLCYPCHIHFAHKDPLGFTAWLKEYKGETIHDDLKLLARTMPKIDLRMTALCFKDELTTQREEPL